MIKAFIIAGILVLLQSCSNKRLIMQAEVVSMTHTDAVDNKKLQVEPQEISETWCSDEEPALKSKDDVYGMSDQVIYKAQGKGEKADFIVGATVHIDGPCATVTGKRAKM